MVWGMALPSGFGEFFPEGNADGGSMQSLVEEMKAAVAMSIAVGCLYSAYALRHAG